MRIVAKKTIVAAIVTLFCITLIPACQEKAIQESPSDAKRVRMLEFEKADLIGDIEKLNTIHANELEGQQQLLDKCEKENEALRINLGKNTGHLLNQMLMPLRQENEELRKENASLKRTNQATKGKLTASALDNELKENSLNPQKSAL